MVKILALCGCLGMIICQWLIYVYSPIEANMGFMQKIFYMHLPMAWWALCSYFVIFICSILYLVKRNPVFDRICVSSAEVGTVLCSLALLTGMIWAKRSWGVWWTWDPRLTTTLVTWFVYVGYLILRGLPMPEMRRNLVCAVVGIVAFLDVPLVFLSARIWRSIHPSVFASQGGGLEPEMKLTALSCVVAFGFIWACLLILRKRNLDLKNIIDQSFENSM